MANEVVIGNLADDKRDDCLRFDSPLDRVGVSIDVEQGDVVEFGIAYWGGDTGWEYVFEGLLPNRVLCAKRAGGGWTDGYGATTTPPFNGVGDYVSVIERDSTITALFNNTGGNEAMEGVFSYLRVKRGSVVIAEYIQNGDFGSETLIDHSGNGNDGIINGAQWWKKDVDQAFSDPLTYRSQLPATPVEVQHVTYTDGVPYYPTGDPFWGLYDENWLTVAELGGHTYLFRNNLSLNLALEL